MDDFVIPSIESATSNPDFIRQRRLESKPHPGKCWTGKQLRRSQSEIEVCALHIYLFIIICIAMHKWMISYTMAAQNFNIIVLPIINISYHIHAHTEIDANLGLQHFPTGETPKVEAGASNRIVQSDCA